MMKGRIVMSVNIKALTITGIVVAAVSYAVCAVFVAVAPDAATTIGSYIVHMDLSKVGRSVTWGSALTGLIFFTAFVALVCATSGWLYNRIAGRSEG
jgi:small-conductance mechanosensitive channel